MMVSAGQLEVRSLQIRLAWKLLTTVRNLVQEKLPFNRKKPRTSPSSWWGGAPDDGQMGNEEGKKR